jgi:puromycin-sensitive aminopeptidase
VTDVDPYRLPTTVTPSRYELRLEPDLAGASFTGTVAIAVDVHDEASEIVMNALDLEITEAWVEPADGWRQPAEISLDAETERLTLTLAEALAPGAYTVQVEFSGVLNDKLRGFYRSTFTDAEGASRTLAVTQMEATHARRAFPCWDEPEAKAVFGVTLVVDDDLLALSNGAELDRTPTDDGRVAVRFADTMKMSTYLVAFIVGPLEVTEPVDAGGTPLRIAHPLGQGHLTDFALDVGKFSLAFFEDYYGIPYPGGKLDLIAVPDFAFGAMENLGAVTFREVLLLVDPARATQPEQERVVDVIAHELAHMWFGDLVTMKWWNGIWLNEAFATFMEILTTDAYRPEWDRWTSFGMERSMALDTDALAATRPIEYPVVSPDEAEGMFDVLTYQKGASVVRMLEQYLGAERFRDGIRTYLTTHSYGNTETTDLWDAIEQASGEPVRAIMDSWIFQGGHPMVSAELLDDGTTLRLRQEPFRYLDAGGDPDFAGRTWLVPVLLRHGSGDGEGTTERLLLEGTQLDVDLGTTPDWVVVNSGGSGVYRVRYATGLRQGLAGRAQTLLSPLERYGLVEDAWAAVVAGASTVDEFLDLARTFADETDLSVWQRLTAALGSIDRLVPAAERGRWQAHVRALLAPALRRLGDEPEEGETDRTSTLRAVLFEAVGTLGDDADVQRRAAEIDARSAQKDAAVDPELAAAAVRVRAAKGDAALFDEFVARSDAADTPQESLRYLGALADFSDPGQFQRFLDRTLTDDIRTQDAPFLLRRSLVNRANGGTAWTFIRQNWDGVNTRFPTSSIPRLLEGVRTFTDAAVANDVRGFLGEHPLPQGAKQVAQHLERMQATVALAEREAPKVAGSFR